MISLLVLPFLLSYPSLFFFTAPPPTAFYTLSLHDALPICLRSRHGRADPIPAHGIAGFRRRQRKPAMPWADRKSTRLNSSHRTISYAVFCLKKKKKEASFISRHP